MTGKGLRGPPRRERSWEGKGFYGVGEGTGVVLGRGREWVPEGGRGALLRGEEISEEEAFPCRRGRVILGLEGLVRKEGLLAWE